MAVLWLAGLSPDLQNKIFLVIVGLVIFGLAWLAARALVGMIGRSLLQRHFSRTNVELLSRVATMVVLVVGGFVGLGVMLGNGNVALAGVLAATIVASLGVQDILRSYVSGFYLLLEKHFNAGDTVEFDGNLGVITDIRLRVTLLRSEDGSLVVVPNAELFNKTVKVARPPAADEVAPEARGARVRKKPRG